MATVEVEPQVLKGGLHPSLRWGAYLKHLKIVDRRTRTIVSLEPNNVQIRIRETIEGELAAGRPVRIIILKARQMGVSTLIQATFAHLAFVLKRFSAMTGAHEDKSSKHLHGMTEGMYEALPAALKPEKRTNERGKRLEFVSGSDLTTFTANGSRDGTGRGLGSQALHCSEVAYWPDAAGTLLSLRQTVADEPNTFVILESTANGIGDTFHEEWERAVSGESGYIALFFGWWEFDDYSLALDHQLVGLIPGLADRLRAGDLDSEEHALVHNFDVTLEQLAWRAYTIKAKCGGKVDRFHQEYPSTADEAFLSSGRQYFRNLSAVPTTPPRLIGRIDGDPVRGGRIAFKADSDGPVSIWEVPRRNHGSAPPSSYPPGDPRNERRLPRVWHRYVIGADCAGSVVSAEHEARPVGAKTDAYCAYVVDIDTSRTVARLYGRDYNESSWAKALCALGSLYGNATIAQEKQGGYGTTTITLLRDTYGYSMQFEQRDDDSTDRNDGTGALGFPMTLVNRPIVLAKLTAALEDTPEVLVDPELIAEMRVFVENKLGRPEADRGQHDDRVLARAIAQHVRDLLASRVRRAPLTPQQIAEREKAAAARQRRARNSIVSRTASPR